MRKAIERNPEVDKIRETRRGRAREINLNSKREKSNPTEEK